MTAGRAARPWDVVIIGGGPAGLATALATRRHGLAVLVLEGRPAPPLDKPCGEGLMPDGLAALARLGVALEREAGWPLAGIRYLDSRSHAEARFAGRPGIGMRRTRLHATLAAAAEDAGAVIRYGVRARALEPAGGGFDAVETPDGAVCGRFFVAADGLRSPLRAQAGLAGRPEPRDDQRFGVRRHVRLAPWSDFVEVYWRAGSEAYVTPVGRHEVGIACLWRGPARGFDDLIARHPALAQRLEGAAATSRDSGCGPLRQRVRGVVCGNLALVGDAAGYVDAITGEGLAVAFQQAEALGAALARRDLGVYTASYRRLCTVSDRMTGLVLALARRPALRRRALHMLARRPALFARLLAVHTRDAPPRGAVMPVLRLLSGI